MNDQHIICVVGGGPFGKRLVTCFYHGLHCEKASKLEEDEE